MSYDVFISYANEDKTIASTICDNLETEKIYCWIAPRDIQPGKDWAEAIIEGIESCRLMILVFSSFANSSKQVMREVERAVQKGLIIITLRFENIPFSKSLEYFLSTSHWIDANDMPFQKYFHKVTGFITKSFSEQKRDIAKKRSNAQQSLKTISARIDEIDTNITTDLIEFPDSIIGFDILPFGQGFVVCYPYEAQIVTGLTPSLSDKRIRFENAEAAACAVSKDGELIAVGDCSATVSIYNLKNGNKITTLKQQTRRKEEKRFKELGIDRNSFEYGEVAFSPDGLYVAAGRRIANRESRRINYPHDVYSMDEPVDVYTIDGQFKFQLPGYGSSPIIRFSCDSKYILLGLELEGVDNGIEGDNLAVYKIEDGTKLYSTWLDGFVRGIAIHPDGSQMIASLGGDDNRGIRFLSVTSGKERRALSYKAIPDNGRYPCAENVCIDGTGQYIATSHNKGVLRFWDARKKTLLRTWHSNSFNYWINKLSFNSSGDYLLASLRSFPNQTTTELLAMVNISQLIK